MNLLIAILVLVLVALVVAVVGAPLWRAHAAGGSVPGGGEAAADDAGADPDENLRDQLEAAREAKYREIRDAELDYRTGKLSREDYDAIDADLRAEALEILDRLEALTPRGA